MRSSELKPDYPVETSRLLLRPFDPATDIDAVHAYASRSDVCRFLRYSPRSREQVASRLADGEHSSITEVGDGLNLAVVERSSGELIGDVALEWTSAAHRCGSVGYVFNPLHHGRGYATEAARAVLALAFDGLGLHRVTAWVDARNVASMAVLRKTGMRQESHRVRSMWFKGEWIDVLDFAILESEWRRRG